MRSCVAIPFTGAFGIGGHSCEDLALHGQCEEFQHKPATLFAIRKHPFDASKDQQQPSNPAAGPMLDEISQIVDADMPVGAEIDGKRSQGFQLCDEVVRRTSAHLWADRGPN